MVLSGYLMVYQSNAAADSKYAGSASAAGHFYIRRLFRIAPLYYLVLIFLIFFGDQYKSGYATLQAASPQNWVGATTYLPGNIHYSASNMLMHFSFLFGMFPQFGSSTLLPDWSIGLEMQFYALFPLCLWMFRRLRPLPAGLIMWVGAVAAERLARQFLGSGGFAEPSFLPLKFEVFLAGMLVASAGSPERRHFSDGTLTLALAVVIASRQSGYVLGVVCLMALLGRQQGTEGPLLPLRRGLATLLGNRLTHFLADTSYGLYLVHGLFISLVGGWMYRQAPFLSLEPRARVLALVTVTMVGSYSVAWLLYRFIEQPGIILGRSLTRKPQNRPSGS
jgi:peptidoglycan/LPS O-acetylase OafA/YrhL